MCVWARFWAKMCYVCESVCEKVLVCVYGRCAWVFKCVCSYMDMVMTEEKECGFKRECEKRERVDCVCN